MRPKNLARCTGSILAALALVAARSPVQAQVEQLVADAPAHGRWTEAVEISRSAVQSRMEELGVPGVSVAVAVAGDIVWAEGFGWADVENRVGAGPHTKLRIASISKALTAGAVGRLLEVGRLDLDAPVQRYVPTFPPKDEGAITTRLLAGHIAGVRHYRDGEFESDVQYDDVVDALAIFAGDPLESEPGTTYSYSTYGWNLISAVVRGASGQRFLTYMREQVLDPLGMDATVAEHNDSIIAYRGRQYRRGPDGRLLNAPAVNNSNKWAGGGYLSTATDLARYGVAHLTGELLRPETVTLFWTSQTTRDGRETGYGIGWFTRNVDGRRQVWHTGGAVGGSTILMIWPDDQVVVSILTNLESARPIGTAREIAAAFASAAH